MHTPFVQVAGNATKATLSIATSLGGPKRNPHTSSKGDASSLQLMMRVEEAMRSQVSFVMHADDERALAEELLCDPVVLFIDGPIWKTSTPPTTRDISTAGNHCIIWSPEDLCPLPANYRESVDNWYCSGDHATIQFLRSQTAGAVVTIGRFAIGTLPEDVAAANVERRYKFLRRVIKRSYSNSVVRWYDPEAMGTRKLSKPTRDIWVGPAAMGWLAEDQSRCIKQWLHPGGAAATIDPPEEHAQ
jgi:hypothetical protein